MRTGNKLSGQSNSQELHCPVIGQSVVTQEWKRLAIPGGQAAWGHCPACQGWHVVLGSETETRLTVAGVEVFNTVS